MRFELASPEWVEAVRGVIQGCLAACGREGIDTSDLSFSICEVSTDPPPHIGAPGSTVGWHCRVKAGELVDFSAGEATDVDYRLVADYASMHQMSGFEIGEDPGRAEQYTALAHSLYDAGKLAVHGKMPRMPAPFRVWHDAMARQTL